MTRRQSTSPKHTARRTAGASPGDFVCLKVSDTGKGIPPEAMPHIFEPFFTTKDVGKGTGLGLATIYGIVQQHRGWVKVLSQQDKETVFEVYLPAIAGKGGSEASVAPEPQIRGGTRNRAGGGG